MKHKILTQCTAKDFNSHGDATSPGPRMDSNHSSSYGRDYGIVDNCVPVTVAREILQKQFQDETSVFESINQSINQCIEPRLIGLSGQLRVHVKHDSESSFRVGYLGVDA